MPAPASVPDWFLPLPPGVPGFSNGASGGAVAADEAAERPFEPPSVKGTVADPAQRHRGGREEAPLSVDAALREIDAEAEARSLTAVEAAIATALDGRDARGWNEAPQTLPSPPAPPEFSAGFSAEAPSAFAVEALAEPPPPPPPPFFEPRLSPPPPPPAFAPLVADPALRPDLRPRPVAPQVYVEAVPSNSVPFDDIQLAEAPRDYWAVARRAGRIAGIGAGIWLSVVLLLIVAYRFVNPPVSALMVQKWLFGQDIAHAWVPIEDMSPNIVRAVLLSEDGRFCQHYGVDFEALEDAVTRTGGAVRGASTISMQVIKNLFLWPSKSYLRKAIELPLTYVMELVWPKRRIMEVYLNIAEWGPGIFGIETAALYHFKKPAKNLNEREAARLAVALPNPLMRNAGKPGAGTQRLAGAVQVRMRLAPSSQTACVIRKRGI